MTTDPSATRPQFRHAASVPLPWAEQMLNPARWRVGHWAMFGALLTFAADVITFMYLFNLFGVNRNFEIEMWLLIAGIMGFVTIVAALWAIFFKSGRGTGIAALIIGFLVGAPPAWLVGNTIIQFVINGGSLPVAPAQW